LLVDSHCHLNYLEAPDAALRNARSAGISGFLCIGVEQKTLQEVLDLAQRHPDVWASVGQHPEAALSNPQWIDSHLAADSHAIDRIVALGEMGLDFFHSGDDAETRRRQQECFDYQLGLARRRDYPAVIHTRSAEDATRQLLVRHAGVRGVLHCFTESWELASAALDLGYYISISGIVTFKNGDNVRKVAAKVPRDRLLVETDSPWLAPVPYRGKQNQPAFVGDTARFLADWLQWDFAELAAQTTENFYRLFSRARPYAGE
jgi:TatD DNase family protein